MFCARRFALAWSSHRYEHSGAYDAPLPRPGTPLDETGAMRRPWNERCNKSVRNVAALTCLAASPWGCNTGIEQEELVLVQDSDQTPEDADWNPELSRPYPDEPPPEPSERKRPRPTPPSSNRADAAQETRRGSSPRAPLPPSSIIVVADNRYNDHVQIAFGRGDTARGSGVHIPPGKGTYLVRDIPDGTVLAFVPPYGKARRVWVGTLEYLSAAGKVVATSSYGPGERPVLQTGERYRVHLSFAPTTETRTTIGRSATPATGQPRRVRPAPVQGVVPPRASSSPLESAYEANRSRAWRHAAEQAEAARLTRAGQLPPGYISQLRIQQAQESRQAGQRIEAIHRQNYLNGR